MSEETNDNQVSVAFNLVLDELPKAREDLVKDLTDAAERGDYEAVDYLNQGLKKIDGLQKEVLELKQEWDSISSSITAKHNPSPPAIKEVFPPPAIHESADTPQQSANRGRSYSSQRRSVVSGLPHGIKTPNEAYEQPILETLVEMGGSGRSRDVLVRVKENEA